MEKERLNLELNLKHLQSNLNPEESRKLYNHCQNDLESIYESTY